MSHDHAAALPDSSRAMQMIFWEVIERWHRHEEQIHDWDEACAQLPPRQSQGWAALVEHLQLINTFQWHEEDRSREAGSDDTILAAVKRSIDASNGRRVQTVDALDTLIHQALEADGLLNTSAPLHSESVASIVDRLTVLALKNYHLKEALAAARQRPDTVVTSPTSPAADPELASLYEGLRTVSEQHVDLGECLDRLLDDVRAGRTRLKLYHQVKFYRDQPSP